MERLRPRGRRGRGMATPDAHGPCTAGRTVASEPQDYPAWVAGVAPDQRAAIAFVSAATWPDAIKREAGYLNEVSGHKVRTPIRTVATRTWLNTAIGTAWMCPSPPMAPRAARDPDAECDHAVSRISARCSPTRGSAVDQVLRSLLAAAPGREPSPTRACCIALQAATARGRSGRQPDPIVRAAVSSDGCTIIGMRHRATAHRPKRRRSRASCLPLRHVA